LVKRSSFRRLELVIAMNHDCQDLLLTIESNSDLRLKLKSLVPHQDINLPYKSNERHEDRELFTSGQYFRRFLSLAQNLEEVKIVIEQRKENHMKDSDYAVLFSRFNFNQLQKLHFSSYVPAESSLYPLLSRCPNLKHLAVFCEDSYLDGILAACPSLLSLEASHYITIQTKSEMIHDSSDGTSISPKYGLRSFEAHASHYNNDSMVDWLGYHCPRLSFFRLTIDD